MSQRSYTPVINGHKYWSAWSEFKSLASLIEQKQVANNNIIVFYDSKVAYIITTMSFLSTVGLLLRHHWNNKIIQTN